MGFIGQPLSAGNLSVDVFTGNGSTTVFALTYSVGSSESLAIYLDGVKQAVSTYTASGTVLTFTTAPPNGVGIEVVFLALSISLPTPGDGTVTAAKIATDAVTTAKILDANVTTAKILDANVTTAKIAANAVDETKLKDALVADFTEVVVSASDSILLGDATDSGNTKRDTVQGILDLVPAGAAVGNGQQQTNVTASRVKNTVYTNSTGVAIFMSVICSTGTGGGVRMEVDSVAVPAECYTNSSSGRNELSNIVPNGETYKLVVSGSAAILAWMELR